jgi:dihydroflavonol-4-reductase
VSLGGEPHHQPDHRHETLLDGIGREQELLERDGAEERVVAEHDERVLLAVVESDPCAAHVSFDFASVRKTELRPMVHPHAELVEQEAWKHCVGRACVDKRLHRLEAVACRACNLELDPKGAHLCRYTGAAASAKVTAMVVYVTGASGFVGGHVARALRSGGYDVRHDWVDLLDARRLRHIVAGCDAVVHVAALYSFTAPARELEAVNVVGTRNVIDAARAARARLLATSSCATCGPTPGRQATEDDRPPEWELAVPYKRTKLEAEQLVLAAGGTCVNPTTPVGEGDRAPTPTGAMIRGVAVGRYRAYPSIGLNVVDVRDVARGHVLALERGRPGERYLLGGADLRMRDLFAAVARLAGRPAPRVPVPYAAIRAGAALGLVNRNEAILARTPAYFSSAKAERELGYRPGPVEPALARAVLELVLPPELLRQRADPDHAEEDQADDQHAGDDVLAFRGGVGEQREHRARV